ncbi:unnamed protein product [Allacma fusca]|uniref:Uncharacterized protein n=1 Tax=Allacma fusca TaxID=39272 RepID=A0A8J2Q0P5_9HEXA|nr:unnamed protein product [Allacma fusca]
MAFSKNQAGRVIVEIRTMADLARHLVTSAEAELEDSVTVTSRTLGKMIDAFLIERPGLMIVTTFEEGDTVSWSNQIRTLVDQLPSADGIGRERELCILIRRYLLAIRDYYSDSTSGSVNYTSAERGVSLAPGVQEPSWTAGSPAVTSTVPNSYIKGAPKDVSTVHPDHRLANGQHWDISGSSGFVTHPESKELLSIGGSEYCWG